MNPFRTILALLLTALLASCAAPESFTASSGLAVPAQRSGSITLGTPYPVDKPEDWTFQDCSRTDKSTWPAEDGLGNIQAGYCVILVKVNTLTSGGCEVSMDTPGLIYISPNTKVVFWRMGIADALRYQFVTKGIVVRNNTSNFRDEPTDKTRRWYALSRLTSENRVYPYDILVETRIGGTLCTKYGPLIVNRD